jgi:thymidylate synthase
MKRTLDEKYLELANEILETGTEKENRTGINTISITGTMIKHDMADGFPLLTTKRVFYKAMAVELEGFIKGITSKDWYKSKGCNIWNEWCNPAVIPSNLKGQDRKDFMLNENDLGKVYGSQWRNFDGQGYDQVKNVLNTLQSNPNDRRMIVSAWNPNVLDEQALPPCHVLWHVIVRDGKLDLIWYQRSVDVFLGLPFNIASYGLLLSLLAKETGFEPGTLTGFLGDTHLYVNHKDQIKLQTERLSGQKPLPRIEIAENIDVLHFDCEKDVKLIDYSHCGIIAGKVAI